MAKPNLEQYQMHINLFIAEGSERSGIVVKPSATHESYAPTPRYDVGEKYLYRNGFPIGGNHYIVNAADVVCEVKEALTININEDVRCA